LPRSLTFSFSLFSSYYAGQTEEILFTMPDITLRVNGVERKVNVSADTPLLWVLRDTLNLTGTKFGCGAGLCGACTVHVNGAVARSCSTPVSQVAGKEIVTIEGLSANNSHPLQQAWIAEDVPQCGYCQSGQIMAAAALLSKHATPSDDEITQAMSGNLCRCGTYQRIRHAIHRAASGGGAQ
jgi:isoquinoline 1-oxidoreductase subunit alpha